jgi:hypothetical protein
MEGRVAVEDVIIGGETVIKTGDLITRIQAKQGEVAGLAKIKVRTLVTC